MRGSTETTNERRRRLQVAQPEAGIFSLGSFDALFVSHLMLLGSVSGHSPLASKMTKSGNRYLTRHSIRNANIFIVSIASYKQSKMRFWV